MTCRDCVHYYSKAGCSYCSKHFRHTERYACCEDFRGEDQIAMELAEIEKNCKRTWERIMKVVRYAKSVNH